MLCSKIGDIGCGGPGALKYLLDEEVASQFCSLIIDCTYNGMARCRVFGYWCILVLSCDAPDQFRQAKSGDYVAGCCWPGERTRSHIVHFARPCLSMPASPRPLICLQNSLLYRASARPTSHGSAEPGSRWSCSASRPLIWQPMHLGGATMLGIVDQLAFQKCPPSSPPPGAESRT